MSLLRPALVTLAALTALVGLLYPAVVTLAARALFAEEAGGSLLRVDGVVVGSALVGQPFADPRYFWGRPSATTPRPYDAAASGGANLGPNEPALLRAVAARVAALRTADPGNGAAVPVDLVTSSASGLDPDVSPEAAHYQVRRVARARGWPEAQVRRLVEEHVRGTSGLYGERHVNVLLLNLALDRLTAGGASVGGPGPGR